MYLYFKRWEQRSYHHSHSSHSLHNFEGKQMALPIATRCFQSARHFRGCTIARDLDFFEKMRFWMIRRKDWWLAAIVQQRLLSTVRLAALLLMNDLQLLDHLYRNLDRSGSRKTERTEKNDDADRLFLFCPQRSKTRQKRFQLPTLRLEWWR